MMRSIARPTAVGSTITRSALEARWSIFFDKIGLKWKYEPRVCKFYLPDFHVDGLGYVEVKPSVHLLASESQAKIRRFCKEYPEEKLFAFCSHDVSFNDVALYEGEMLYAVTFDQMAWRIAQLRDPELGQHIYSCAIMLAFRTANQSKLDHCVPGSVHVSDALRDLERMCSP